VIVPPAPAPPVIVPLMLRTDPAGATVRRDGNDLGDAPVPLLIPPGERWTIELVKEGYESRTVTVVGGQPELTIHLERVRPAPRPRPHVEPPEPTPQPRVAPPRRRVYAPDLNDPWATQR
jgi:hypothetical protein